LDVTVIKCDTELHEKTRLTNPKPTPSMNILAFVTVPIQGGKRQKGTHRHTQKK